MAHWGGELTSAISLAEFRFAGRRGFSARARTSIFMRFDGRGCSAMVAYVERWAWMGCGVCGEHWVDLPLRNAQIHKNYAPAFFIERLPARPRTPSVVYSISAGWYARLSPRQRN